MSQKPVNMRLIKQVQQLWTDGVSTKEIARRTGMSKNTVKKYIHILESYLATFDAQKGLKIGDKELAEIVYNHDTAPVADKRTEALLKHFSDIVKKKELSQTGVTRQRLWTEYIEQNPDGYQYSQYCNLFRKYCEDAHVAFHWDHKAGEFIQADFAGDTLSYVKKGTGEKVPCQMFVAVLPFSGLIFCYAVLSQRIADFAICIREMLKYFGGVALTILVDNFKTAVKRADLYEPQFTDLCLQLSDHYNTTFSATRPVKPTDKGMAERSVNIIYQQVYAPIRRETFASLEELNGAVRKQLDLLNRRPYKGSKESRMDIFIRAEQSSLKPLPERHFELMKAKHVKVQRNYYLQLPDNKHYYSVPYKYVGKEVEVYFNSLVVEVYLKHERIAVHTRRSTEPLYNRINEHMPKNHQAMVAQQGWTVEEMIQRASRVGKYTTQVAKRIIHSSIYPAQNFKACNAMVLLANQYSKERLEAACQHASVVERPTLNLIRTILKTGQDKAPLLFEQDDKKLPTHENVRGSDYYQ
ncbi:MAG: IS21 family transposase [Candidatus Saccharimonadales bacterium]